MERVYIDLGNNSYTIHIQEGILNYLSDYVGRADKWLLITDDHINETYGAVVQKALEKLDLYWMIIPPGEGSKNISTVENILTKMIELGLTRKSKVIALGGGVVGDIAGFSASIYMRGIPFIQVPTTLLAQVDSSVGGKTGVNLPQGKNMVGSFYQPEAVVIDTDTLKTLPKKELISGIGEIIKYGIIYDYDFLQTIKHNFTEMMVLQENIMQNIIKRCCEIKAEVVIQDEKEKGLRKILNYGHTIGHSLEAVTAYNRYTHGEAVLIGMYYETLISKKLGLIEKEYFQEIEEIIRKVDICLDISEFSLEALVKAMMKDKKNKEGKISFILPTGRGKVEEVMLTGEEVIW